MHWLSGFANRLKRDVPLAPLTWYRLGGRARYLLRPQDADELAGVLSRAWAEGMAVKILGGGANVLVGDSGFDGLVIRLDAPAFRDVDWNGNSVRVGAGVDLMPFARECSYRGYSGLEGLAGIPGTIGGAVRMNAGGRFGDIGDVVREVDVVERDGTRYRRDRQAVGFRYRGSDLGDAVVLSATLALNGSDPISVRDDFDRHFALKRDTQPLAGRSAGCVFKNPADESAGALIDQAGLKGTRVGAACVSPRHANFIVTDRGATAGDVLRLIDHIRDRVWQRFGTELELEIDIW